MAFDATVTVPVAVSIVSQLVNTSTAFVGIVRPFPRGPEARSDGMARSHLSPAFIINQFGFTKDNVRDLIKAADARTLVITLERPTSPSFFYYCLSANVGSVVERAAPGRGVEYSALIPCRREDHEDR